MVFPDTTQTVEQQKEALSTEKMDPVSSAAEKACSSCYSRIDHRASVCPKCRSYQGLYWGLRLIGVGSPWVLGALSLATIAVNNVTSKFPERVNPITTDIYVVNSGDIKIEARNTLNLTVYPKAFAALRCGSTNEAKSRFAVDLRETSGQFSIPAHETKLLDLQSVPGQTLPDAADIDSTALCFVITYIGDGDHMTAEQDEPISLEAVRTFLKH